jgi:hypothetical protein
MKTAGKPTLAVQPTAAPAGSAPLAKVGDEMGSDAGALLAGGATLQRMGTGYQSAIRVQMPRDIERVRDAVIKEAAMAADSFFYFWQQKTRVKDADGNWKEELADIEGPSIQGAMIMIRNWGNCACPIELVQDAPQHWILKSTFIDFETGFNLERLFRQRKAAMKGDYEPERQMDIAFQVGQSKAQRNVVDKAMPIWLVEAAMEAAKAAALAKSDAQIAKKTQAAIKAFGKRGVTQEMLEARVGRFFEDGDRVPADEWDAEIHVKLTGLWNALVDRQTRVEDEFPELAKPAEGEAKGPTEAPKSEPRTRQPGDD